MAAESRKSVNNGVLFLIGVALVVPYYVIGGGVTAVIAMGGTVLVLASPIFAVINHMKSSKT